MREKQQDLRFRRTQRSLRKALLSLLTEKPVDSISVRELAERAEINRATFYLHFSSPHELLAVMESELFDTIMTSYQHNAVQNPQVFFTTVYQSICEHADLAKALLHQNTTDNFWDPLADALRAYYTDHLLRNEARYAAADLTYYLAFVKEGYVSIVKQWIAGGMRESPAYMAALSQRFLSRVRIDTLLE